MKEVLESRISKLEADLKRVKKKVSSDDRDLVTHAIEIAKIEFAIFQLYVCLGEMCSK